MTKSYGQFCAMARALEVVGERWTLLVVRELLCGSTGFNQIRRGIPAISRDTLTRRLRQLGAAGVVERSGTGNNTKYALTEAGEALGPLLRELAAWTAEFDRDGLRPEHLDPDALFWDLHRRIDHRAVPPGRTVVEFALTDQDAARRHVWLMIGRNDAEVCSTDGGYQTDLRVEASTRTLSRWWLGETDWSGAVRAGDIKLVGNRQAQASFPEWFLGYALASDPTSAASTTSAAG